MQGTSNILNYSFLSSPKVKKIGIWGLIALGVLPQLPLIISWFLGIDSNWNHIAEHLLPKLLINTLSLVLLVVLGAGLIGTLLAYIMSHYRFPGHRWLNWALLLPLAIPAYVMAFVFLGWLDYSGLIQTQLRAWGVNMTWDARQGYTSLVIVLSLMFFPYVYGVLKPNFERTYPEMDIQAAALGAGPWRRFWRIQFPLAFPSLFLGMMLVMMETLADYGTVSIFNTPTLTTAIVSAWQDFYSLKLAMQLASLILLVAWTLFMVDHWVKVSRPRVLNKWQKITPTTLKGYQAWSIFVLVFTIFSISFLLPFIQLLYWAIISDQSFTDSKYWSLTINTLGLGLGAMVVILSVAVTFELLKRDLQAGRWIQRFSQLTLMGYALPGNVIAIGVLGILIGLEHQFGLTSGWLSQSIWVLILVLSLRFFILGQGPVSNGLRQISPQMIQSAKSLGASPLRLSTKIYLPLLKPGLIASSGLIFLEVMKELPATYMLRPFDWSALSIYTYELSLEGNYEGAALPALLLVLLGILALWVSQRRRR